MSSGGGGQTTSTVTQQLAPEQRQIMSAAMGRYLDPNGNLPNKPTINTSDPSTRALGENRVAPFAAETNQAFDLGKQVAFAHDPAFNAAQGMTAAGAGPAGLKANLGTGWQAGSNGLPTYQTWNADTAAQFMNPYSSNVIGTGLSELQRQNQILQKGNDDAAVKAGAFGGSRHGVLGAETNRNFADKAQQFISDTLDKSYSQARDQYNQGFGQGMQVLNYDTGIDQADASRMMAGGNQLASIAGQKQGLDAKGVDAIAAIGAQKQGQEQSVRDTAYDEALSQYMFPAQLGQVLSGFAPGPTTTSTGSSKTGAGQLLGVFGSAGISAALPSILGAAFGSDETAKTKIKKANPDKSLDEIRKLGSYTYEYTGDAKQSFGAPEGKRTGFMAQDLEKASGKPGPTMPGGYKGVDIAEHMGRLTHAIQAIDKKLDAVSKRQGRAA
jgi:hypothetical protein